MTLTKLVFCTLVYVALGAGCGNATFEHQRSQSDQAEALALSTRTEPNRIIDSVAAKSLPIVAESGDYIKCSPGVVLEITAPRSGAILVGKPGSVVEGVTVEGCAISDLRTKQPGFSPLPIESAVIVAGAKSVLLKDIRVHDAKGQAAIRVVDSESVTVDGFDIDTYPNMGLAVHGVSSRINVRNGRIAHARKTSATEQIYGLTISGSDLGRYPVNVTVEKVTCEDNAYWDCFDSHGGQNLKFIRNRAIMAAKCFDLGLLKRHPDHVLKQILVQDNYCSGIAQPQGSRTQGIGVLGQNAATVAENVVITGNVIEDASQVLDQPGRLSNRASIHLMNVRNASISNNTVRRSKHAGISLATEVHDFRIQGNRVSNVNSYGIYLGDKLSNGLVHANVADNSGDPKIGASSVTAFGVYIGATEAGFKNVTGKHNTLCTSVAGVGSNIPALVAKIGAFCPK